MRWFRHDAEFCDENSSAGYEDGTQEHPWREDVSKNKSCKERIPEERDGTKGSKDDDWQRSDLEQRSEDVGRNEDA